MDAAAKTSRSGRREDGAGGQNPSRPADPEKASICRNPNVSTCRDLSEKGAGSFY